MSVRRSFIGLPPLIRSTYVVECRVWSHVESDSYRHKINISRNGERITTLGMDYGDMSVAVKRIMDWLVTTGLILRGSLNTTDWAKYLKDNNIEVKVVKVALATEL